MNFDFKKEWWIIAAVIVVLLGVGYWWYSAPGEQVTQFEEGKELVRPEEGAVVSDFPPEFLVEPDVLVGNSYSIRYLGEGATQPVVEYESKKSFEENIKTFFDVLTASNWNVMKFAQANEKPSTSFYATKEYEDVSITFTLAGEKVRVNIVYLRK